MRAIGYGAFALAGLLACSSTSGDGNGASTAQDASAGDGSLGGGHPGGDASIANGDDGGTGDDASVPNDASTGGDVDNAADGVGGALKPPPAALNWTYLPDTSQVSVLSIWGSGPNDVYIVGLVGMGDHFDGAQWTSLDTGTGAHLKAVWGSGPNDVYIATESNALLHLGGDAGAWDHQVFGAGVEFSDIKGWSATDIYADGPGVIHFDTNAWSNPGIDSGDYGVDKLWVTGPADAWGESIYGGVYHYMGTSTVLSTDTGPKLEQYENSAIWASSDTDIYVTGANAILHYRGSGTWENQFPTPAPVDGGGEYLSAIWGFDANTIYAVSQTGMLYRSGGDGRWVSQQLPAPFAGSYPSCIWGSAPDDVYIGGDMGVIHGTKM
jgi:hypothetical protein